MKLQTLNKLTYKLTFALLLALFSLQANSLTLEDIAVGDPIQGNWKQGGVWYSGKI